MTSYERYESLMKEKGIKNADICKAIGIRTSVICDWRAGRYQPKIDKLKNMADYLGVSVDYFFEGNADSVATDSFHQEKENLKAIRDLLLEIKSLKAEVFGKES